MQKKPNILLIYTGGTIGMVKDYETGSLKAFDFKELLKHIPELTQLDCHINSVSFKTPIDSSNMNLAYWIKMASLIESNYENHDGFVVLHGSDTMSYSASALSFMLENLAKPVIFTGSQLPIGDLRTDAKENLITSIQIASLQKKNKPVIREVGLYFEYKLYRGNRTTKINAEHFEAFSSPNYPELAESGVHLKVNAAFLRNDNSSKKKFKAHKKMSNRVGALKLFPGISEIIFKNVLETPDLKVLVLETYGAGNAPTDQWIVKNLKKAIDKGLHIVNITQCAAGSVSMGDYETSRQLKDLQLINGKDITFEAGITKAMYLLGVGVSDKLFRTIYETSLRGEME